MSSDKQKRMQREAMERQRFGVTRHEVFAEKGAVCKDCGSTDEPDLVIDHEEGQGRHATERGMILPETHNMSNLAVRCKSCAGRRDRERAMMGEGMLGNPNNPSQ